MSSRKLTVIIEELPDAIESRTTLDAESAGAGNRPRPEQVGRENDAVPDPPPRKPPG